MPAPWTWSVKARRYRDAKGRFVGVRQMHELRDVWLSHQRQEADALAGRLARGDLTLQQWTLAMREVVKTTWIDNYVLARGGRRQVTRDEWLSVGRSLKKQYGFLQDFAKDIANGTLSAAGIQARSRLYIEAARRAYMEGERGAAREAGLDEESNVLHAAESCEGAGSCVGETRRGWVPLGSLIPVGQRRCGPNCRCEIVYRKAA
jgi:hypothetical protein